jgi:hypothetical protein
MLDFKQDHPDGGGEHLCDVDHLLEYYTVQHPRGQSYSVFLNRYYFAGSDINEGVIFS